MDQRPFFLARVIRRFIIASGLMMVVFPHISRGSGACCTVSLGARNTPTVTLIASTGWSHERISETTYDLRQHALIAKGSLPLGDNFFVSAQLGVPLRTELHSNYDFIRGSSGYLYGIGLGSILPQLLTSFNLYGSVSYARSVGFLKRSSNGEVDDGSFVISEVQGILLGEYELTAETALYGGGRLYSGRNHIRTRNNPLSGEREGSVSPLLGIRHSVWEGVSLVGEGSFGHTRTVSLAMVVSL